MWRETRLTEKRKFDQQHWQKMSVNVKTCRLDLARTTGGRVKLQKKLWKTFNLVVVFSKCERINLDIYRIFFLQWIEFELTFFRTEFACTYYKNLVEPAIKLRIHISDSIVDFLFAWFSIFHVVFLLTLIGIASFTAKCLIEKSIPPFIMPCVCCMHYGREQQKKPIHHKKRAFQPKNFRDSFSFVAIRIIISNWL